MKTSDESESNVFISSGNDKLIPQKEQKKIETKPTPTNTIDNNDDPAPTTKQLKLLIIVIINNR